MWEQTMAKEGVWLLSFFRFEFKWERERESGRERDREGMLFVNTRGSRGIVLFLGLSSKRIKQGFVCVCVCMCERERERERERRKEKAGRDKAEGIFSNFLQRTKAKKKAKNERGAVREGIRESDTTGSCA